MTVITEVASISVVYVSTLHRVCIHVPEEKSAHQLETFGSAGSTVYTCSRSMYILYPVQLMRPGIW